MTEDFLTFSPMVEPKAVSSEIRTTLLFPHDIEIGRLSSSFHDFGRESLGILPEDFGKHSLEFLNKSELFNKSQCAINILSIDEDFDDGRESLGILELNKIFNKQDPKIPNILLTFNESVCDILDTGFFNTSSQKLPSTSSQGSGNISFHTASLEEPSKIFKLSTNLEKVDKDSTNSSGGSLSVLNKGVIISISEVGSRLRIQSLPEKKNYFGTDLNCQLDTDKKIHSLTVNENINNTESDNEFHDSVFIEGKYIAHKIADGSILDDSFHDEIGNLDNIPPPAWNEIMESEKSIEDVSNLQSESNQIENNVSVESVLNTHIASAPVIVESSKNKPIDAREMLQKLSEILNSTGHSEQQISEGQHLLSSLAELLYEKSIARSTNLLKKSDQNHSSSISEQNNSDQLFRPRYGSIDLKSTSSRGSNLSSTSIKDSPNRRMSLSFNPTSSDSKVTRPKLYKMPNLSNIDLSKNKDVSKNSSTKSEGTWNGSLGLPSIKLQNKSADKTTNRGPVKAVIPIKDMKKKESRWLTPDRSHNGLKKTIQLKKMSTPVNRPNLIPVASSTPAPRQAESDSSNATRGPGQFSNPQNKRTDLKNRRSLPSTNTCKNRSGEQNRLNHSHSSIDSPTCSKEKSANPIPVLRKSSTQIKDVKRPNIIENKLINIRGRTRSNSLGSVHTTGLMSSMNKIRENLLNSPEYKKIAKSVLRENNNSESKLTWDNNRKSSEFKPGNMLSKMKTIGKENLAK